MNDKLEAELYIWARGGDAAAPVDDRQGELNVP